MAQRLHLNQEKEVAYLAVYLTLLLVSLSGLMLQGGVWLIIGLAGWFCGCLAILSCLIRYNYRYISKPKKTLK